MESRRLSKAWRIGKMSHALWSGEGAKKYGARWNSPGKEVIYAASSFSLAMLEVLVHVGRGGLPTGFGFIEIDIPKQVSVERFDSAEIVDDGTMCRDFGDQWLDEKRSCLLVVRSVGAPVGDHNVLFNPLHKDFKLIVVGNAEPIEWDSRLFQ